MSKTINEIIKELKGMQTIADRAKAYSKTQVIQSFAYCGYERGATEQRDIDINKAAEWLASNCVLADEYLERFRNDMLNENKE